MKRVILILLAAFLISCEGESCDCDYVVFEKDSPSAQWRETYRSDWTASCGSEVLDNSVYTNWDGSKTYTKREVICK